MSALSARHMVAATVLLNRRITLGTFLRVGRNPVGGFTVVCAFLQPPLDKFAGRWLVIVQDAPEAESMTAPAGYRRNNLVEILLLDGTLDSILAIGGRAPLKSLLVLDVGAVE